MKNYFSSFFIFLTIIFAFLQCTSCTIVGFTVGSVLDADKPDFKQYSRFELDKLEDSENLSIHLKTDSLVFGEFGGIKKSGFGDSTKKSIYLKNAVSLNKSVIKSESDLSPGDDIIILDQQNNQIECKFSNYSYKFIEVNVIGLSQPKYIKLDAINEIRKHNGDTILPIELKQKYFESNLHTIPKREAQQQQFLENNLGTPLNIENQLNKKNRLIGIENIKYIKVKNQKNAKWTGLFLGLAVDVVVIVVAASSLSNMDLGLNFGN